MYKSMNERSDAGTVTQFLHRWNDGDRTAIDDLLPLVYQELRRMAGVYLQRESAPPTVQPTELVHEFFLRMTGIQQPNWRDRLHFFGAAASTMRRVLVERARHRNAAKRSAPTVPLNGLDFPATEFSQLEEVDSALHKLGALDPQRAKVVELRFFLGLTIEETAIALDISPTTVKREWFTAKLWLLREITGGS